MARILVVEDDELLREMYTEILNGGGYTIETAVDGEEAYQKILQGGWDLVLLDIVMPKMNGLDVMQKISSTPPPQNMNKCIIFLTNLDKGEEIERASKLGNGYIIKSQINPGDLLTKVNDYLAGSQQSAASTPESGQPAAGQKLN